ncbi:MAG: nuclear transport factor 2 family protein [Acidobacteria bacterium]|nr:nuclear transport factor 2 family protein [Acidobacteriota bacterium]
MNNQGHSPKGSHSLRRILTVALLTALASSLALAQSNGDEQELIKLQQEWRAAIERGDRDALNRFIADDFSNRGGLNKAQQIEQSLKSTKQRQSNPNLKNFTATPFNYTVKFKGAEMAVMRFSVADKGQFKGQDFTDYRHRTLVWMKRGGRWQIVEADNSPFTDEQVLRLIEREWGDAIKNKNKAWFERTYADGYTAINSRGKIFNKTEDIADTLSSTDTTTSDELSDVKVQVHGDTAIVIGRLHLVGKDKKGSFDRTYTFTDTFIRRDGRWQVISTQATLVAPETTAAK